MERLGNKINICIDDFIELIRSITNKSDISIVEKSIR